MKIQFEEKVIETPDGKKIKICLPKDKDDTGTDRKLHS